MDKLTCAGCRKTYWPNQSWMHKACVNTSAESVNSKTCVNKDRHKPGYMREYMAKRRAKGKS